MAKSIKGTETEKNLLKAFSSESQAQARYTFFAKKARKEKLEKIALIFEETAVQETEHAKLVFKHLEGGYLEIAESFPAGTIGNTLENLKHACIGEKKEWDELYPAWAKVALKEGFTEIAEMFTQIINSEKFHWKRYLKLHDNLMAGKSFKSDNVVVWRCLKCGYLHEGKEAPPECPLCKHPQSYFELATETWD